MMPLKESAQRVQRRLQEMGYANQVVELPDSTRTAQEAADATARVSEKLLKAGHPKAVFELKPDELVSMTQGQIISIQ